MKTKEYANAKNITCKHIIKKVKPFESFEKYYQYKQHSQNCYTANRRIEQYNELYLYVDSLNGNIEELQATIQKYEDSEMYYRSYEFAKQTEELKKELFRLQQNQERIIWDFSEVDTDKEFKWCMNISLKGWEL